MQGSCGEKGSPLTLYELLTSYGLLQPPPLSVRLRCGLYCETVPQAFEYVKVVIVAKPETHFQHAHMLPICGLVTLSKDSCAMTKVNMLRNSE